MIHVTLKANLLEELSKLRLSRERPIGIKQTKQKKDKAITKEEQDLLNQLNLED